MSSSELINSASEDENNWTKESETSEFQQSPLKKIAQEKNHRIQKKTLVAMERKYSLVFLWEIQTNGYSCRKHLLLG